eukprot:2477143-Amphidinium_carterae.1
MQECTMSRRGTRDVCDRVSLGTVFQALLTLRQDEMPLGHCQFPRDILLHASIAIFHHGTLTTVLSHIM